MRRWASGRAPTPPSLLASRKVARHHQVPGCSEGRSLPATGLCRAAPSLCIAPTLLAVARAWQELPHHPYTCTPGARQGLLPTTADLRRRQELLQRMRDLAQRGLAGYLGLKVVPFGSYVIGLCSADGDLDLTIEGEYEE